MATPAGDPVLANVPPPERGDGPDPVLVVGTTKVAYHTQQMLRGNGTEFVSLAEPDDQDLLSLKSSGIAAAAILVHDDVQAIRYALAVAHIMPGVHIVVTIFDRTLGRELERLLPQTQVRSPADIVSALLAEMAVPVSPTRNPPTRWSGARGRLNLSHLLALRTTGSGALLRTGIYGLFAVLVGDTIWQMAAHNRSLPDALFESARVVAGVGPTTSNETAVYNVVASAAMLATIALTALFTVGLVEYFLAPRLAGAVGARAIPTAQHVIVVGMGQVGYRLCIELRNRGIGVVGVDRSKTAPGVRLAKASKVPVVIADGSERAVMEHLRLNRAAALAAVGSEDLDNVAVAIAAHGIAPGVRVVMRAGESESIAETQALLPLGEVCDVAQLSAAFVVGQLTPHRAAREY